MALATANGNPVIAAKITIPRFGLWTADMIVADAGSISGACSLVIDGGLTLIGTAARAGVWLDTTYCRMLPGAGGLGKLAKAKHYRNTTFGVVIKDLLAAAGERLAGSADASLLRQQLTAYTQQATPIGLSLSELLSDRRLAKPVWRALADGTIWAGTESYPDSGLEQPDDYQDIDERPHEGRAELGIVAPGLMAGVGLGGRNVSAIEYAIRDGNVRMRTLFED